MQQKSSNSIKLFGFGIIKNGIKFDFPFKESILSMQPICQRIFYLVGNGEDQTKDELLKFSNFCSVSDSVWNMELKDGHVIGEETNKVLKIVRSSVDVKNAWGIYLQADEVLYEEDYNLLLADLEKAENEGYDSISFRYLHFWQSHHHLAISKTWYPHEIRAIKLDSTIMSWGDGQSFSNCKKIFYTEARIFHYGHVRSTRAYKSKMQFQASFHFKGIRYYRKRVGAFINHLKQKTIKYLGPHPEVMHKRIKALGENTAPSILYDLCIVGNATIYSSLVLQNILAKSVLWVENKSEIPNPFNGRIIDLKNSKIPSRMASSLAKNWSEDFQLILKLSEQDIWVGSKIGKNADDELN